MPGFSTYAADLVLAYFFNRGAPPAVPSATYLVLYNGNPTAGGTIAPGFAPVLVNTDLATSPHWSAPLAYDAETRMVRNVQDVLFGAATANAGLVDYGAVFDGPNPAVANRLGVGTLAPKNVSAGETYTIPALGAQIRLD